MEEEEEYLALNIDLRIERDYREKRRERERERSQLFSSQINLSGISRSIKFTQKILTDSASVK